MAPISTIIPAAGSSRRIGAANKLLLPFGNKTIIEHVVLSARDSDVSEVIVVVGHQARSVSKKIENIGVRCIVNERYRRGMTSSIQMGVMAASPETNGYMILPGDMALVRTDELNKLAELFTQNFSANDQLILVPVHKGKRGNPVIFSALYKQEILVHGKPNGCKAILERHIDQVAEFEMENDNTLIDIDSEEDYLKYIKRR